MSLKHAILVLLETEPSSGYDLLKQFQGSLGYFWNAKHQQIYQQLKTLTEDGLIHCDNIDQQGKPNKKLYKILDPGVEELKRWLNQAVKPSKVNDALLVKLYGGHLIDQSELIAEVQSHLKTHQTTLNKLEDMEKTYQALPDDKREQYKLPYITLRRGIIGEHAWITWAEETLNSLKK